jgi:ABC-type transport system involved in multi-copper enzyme maturation permease subunit
MRWGLGPVFIYECLTSSRRPQFYWARSIAASALLLVMAILASQRASMTTGMSVHEYAILGKSYFYSLIGVELTLVMLIAPAVTAGAICLDRSRGALHHLLVTDLSDAEIVLGKLAARLLPILGLIGCSVPALAISALLGGIEFPAVILGFAWMIVVSILCCTFALALSVWARKPHEVVLANYTLWISLVLVWPIWLGLSNAGLVGSAPSWVQLTNPFYVAFAPVADPGAVGYTENGIVFAVTLAASALFAGLAIWRMRPVACRSTRERPRGRRLAPTGRMLRWLPGPSLDGNPVLWREWYRTRPSRWTLSLLLLVGGSTTAGCIFSAIRIWFYAAETSGPNLEVVPGVFGYIIQMILGMLMLSAVAPMSMSDERQRGSLDVLTSTPLSTPAIVLGKWFGTFRTVPLLIFGPALMTLALATGTSRTAPESQMSLAYRLFGVAVLVSAILVHGAWLTSFGLALAIWTKRQSHAISISVVAFVLTAVVWPILVDRTLGGSGLVGLESLSVIGLAGILTDALGIRAEHFIADIWWAAFCNVETAVWAIGLLWLSVQTFDRCVGRTHDKRGSRSILPDILVIWGIATVVACCACGALSFWPQGIASGASPPTIWTDGKIGMVCLVAVDFLMLAIVAPIILREESTDADHRSVDYSVRSIAYRAWLRSFRLAALLAAGPGLMAFALALSPTEERLEISPQTMPLAAIMAAKLLCAVVFIFSLLVHGALTTSLGIVLTLRTRRLSSAIALNCSVTLMITVAWPIFALRVTPAENAGSLAALSPVGAVLQLFEHLSRAADRLPLTGWLALCDVVIAYVAIRLLVGASRIRAGQPSIVGNDAP